VRLADGAAGAAAPAPFGADAPTAPTAPTASAASAAFAEGRVAGAAAAGRMSGAWGLRGLLGGTLAGPVGLGLAVHYAGTSSTTPPTPPAAADAAFVQGFQEGFETRTHAIRRKSAFVGGMVGTAILTTALIYLMDLSGNGSGTRDNGGGSPQFGIVR
jgi:hypothetical protein